MSLTFPEVFQLQNLALLPGDTDTVLKLPILTILNDVATPHKFKACSALPVTLVSLLMVHGADSK